MKLFLLRFWLIFDMAEQPNTLDKAGAYCTAFAVPLNLMSLFSMATINGFLTIVISLLSIAWLCMRVYREWGATKEYVAAKKLEDDEED